MQVFGVGCRCYGCTDHWHLSAFLLLHGPGFVGVDYDVDDGGGAKDLNILTKFLKFVTKGLMFVGKVS